MLTQSSRFVCAALCGLLMFGVASQTEGQGKAKAKKKKDRKALSYDGYEPLIDLQGVKQIARTGRGRTTIEITFHLSKSLPAGAKIDFNLVNRGALVDGGVKEYEVAGAQKRNLTLEWTPRGNLDPSIDPEIDAYYVKVELDPKKQNAAVKRQISKAYKTKDAPWPFTFRDTPLLVGSREELDKLVKEACDVYGKFIDRLINNYKDFSKIMAEVEPDEESEEAVDVDLRKLRRKVLDWRTSQAKVQNDILKLQMNRQQLLRNTSEAFIELLKLGRMVSKTCVERQEAFMKSLEEEDFKFDGRREKAKLEGFDAGYADPVDRAALNRVVSAILASACPETKKEDTAKKPATKPSDGDAQKGDAKKDEGDDGKAAATADKDGKAEKKGKKKKRGKKKRRGKSKD